MLLQEAKKKLSKMPQRHIWAVSNTTLVYSALAQMPCHIPTAQVLALLLKVPQPQAMRCLVHIQGPPQVTKYHWSVDFMCQAQTRGSALHTPIPLCCQRSLQTPPALPAAQWLRMVIWKAPGTSAMPGALGDIDQVF